MSTLLRVGLSICAAGLALACAEPNGATLRAPPAVAPPPADVIAFDGVELVPMDSERVLHRQRVLVRDGLIVQVGDADRVAIPAGATVIDGQGAYLAPGLADMHVHLYDTESFPSYLAYGVTTVANLNGSPRDLAWRAAVARGDLVGPTIYTAGPSVNGDPPGNATFDAVMDAEGGKRAVDEQVRAGYDFIKVYSTLDVAPYDAIVDEARAQNVAVLGHIPFCVGAERALTGYQSNVAHGEEFLNTYFHGNAEDASRLPDLVKLVAASGKTVTPNLVAYSDYLRSLDGLDAVLHDPEMRFASPALLSEKLPLSNRSVRDDPAAFGAALRKGHALFQKMTKAFSGAHVPLLLGTDTEVFGFPGLSALLELHELQDAGLSPYQAMVAATRAAGEYVARWVHPQERFGVIAPGERADMVLLDGNPLEGLDNLRKLRGVMTRGRWLTIDRIADLREEKARTNTPLRDGVVAVEGLVRDGKFDEAAARVEALHREHPTAKILAERVLAGYARRASKTAPAAAARMRELNVELYPDSFSAHTDAARGYLASGDRAGARRHLAQATAMSPSDVVARDLLEKVNLLDVPPVFDPVGHYDISVAAKQGLCGAETTLLLSIDLTELRKGTFTGTVHVGGDTGKIETLTHVEVGADHLWLTGDSASLRLIVEADGKTVRGRYIGGFAANFPLTGKRTAVR